MALLPLRFVKQKKDSVARSSYYKYHHPKECLVSGGVLNSAIDLAAGKVTAADMEDDKPADSLEYLYPYGATLTVQKPAVPVLSTGPVSIPLNRPTCAFCQPKRGGGKLAVLGSCHMFHDSYLTKEENGKVLDVLLEWLTADSISLNQVDADEPEVFDYHFIPHTAKLAENPKTCLQEGEEVPRDFTTLFDQTLHQLDTDVIPDAVRAFDELGVAHEPLQLITPQFETPLPPLNPAVFPPTFREVEPPALDLFDLDDQFSNERVRLNQLTNKCTDDDLEYFLRECGNILGVSQRLDSEKRDGKHILE